MITQPDNWIDVCDVSSLNIDTIIGSKIYDLSDQFIDVPSFSRVINGKYSTYQCSSNFKAEYIVLQYTKTTDTATVAI